MASRKDISGLLEELDLGPLGVAVEGTEVVLEGGERADAVVRLMWDAASGRQLEESRGPAEREWTPGGWSEAFEVVFKTGRSLRDVRNAAWYVRDASRRPGGVLRRLLVMPYLSRAALGLLREMGVDGLDLCGNGVVQGSGWWFYQQGNPNRYSKQRSRAPYRGKSALVGRALLLRPQYEAIGDVQEEVQRRGASISLSQVSKVLSALEDDLVIRKRGNGVQLLQPSKLLDSLADAYAVPEPTQTLEAKAELGQDLFRHLRDQAGQAGARIVGVDAQRYVAAPQSRERMEVYVEPSIGADLSEAFGLIPASRFATLVVHVTDEPGVYFDPVESGGFGWAPPLEVYLQLMQGGKREKEIAGDLRASLLPPSP